MTDQTKLESFDGPFKFFSRIPIPVPPKPTDMAHPSLAIIREISLDKSRKSVVVDFSKRPAIYQLNNNANGNQFLDLLKKIATNTHIYGTNKPSAKPDLALNNKYLSYLVFRLSDQTDWQFAFDFPPISLSPIASKSECYFEANRVDDSGNIVPMLDANNNVIEHDGCHVAYFIADGAKAVADSPSGYEHSYNLNVDFLEMEDQLIKYRLPVTIDPDVRNPGGGGS